MNKNGPLPSFLLNAVEICVCARTICLAQGLQDSVLRKPSLVQGRQLHLRSGYPHVTENPMVTDSSFCSGGKERELSGDPPVPRRLSELRRWAATGEREPTELCTFLPSRRKWVPIRESVHSMDSQHLQAQGKKPAEKGLPSPRS